MDEEHEVKLNALKNKLLKNIQFVKNKNIPKPYRLNKAVVVTDIDLELDKIELAVMATVSFKILNVFEHRIKQYLKIAVKPHDM